MGDPRKLRKRYSTPRHPYEKDRIEEENKLMKDYGLKNKREIWRAEAVVRKYRTLARKLQAERSDESNQGTQELMAKLVAIKLIGEGATLDDVLGLTITDLLDRRFQTRVFKKGLARSPKQARQFIVHGLIKIGKRKMTVPGYLVKDKEDSGIGYYGKVPELETPLNAEVPVAETSVERVPETKPSVPVPDTKPSIPSKEASK